MLEALECGAVVVLPEKLILEAAESWCYGKHKVEF